MEDDFIADEIINSQTNNKRETRLECHICKKKFKFHPLLKNHFKNKHPEEKPYKCDHCSYQSELLSNVNRHKRTKSCKPTNMLLSLPNQMHPRFKHDITNTSDPSLNESLNQDMEDDFITDEIINSQQRNKKGILMECRICSKKVNGDLDLLSHFKNKHPEEKPYKCDHCDYQSKFLANVNRHKQRIYLNIKDFECDICLNLYNSNIALTDHKMRFHTKKDSPCVLCSQRCTDRYTLNQHYKHIHPLEEIICEYCGEIFTRRSSVTRHKYRCIKSFTCKDCGQIFKYKNTLKLHNNNCLGNKNNNYLDRKNIEANSPSHTENPNQEISHLNTSFEENDPPPYDTAFDQYFPPSLYTQTQEKEEIGNILEDLLDLENCLREKST